MEQTIEYQEAKGNRNNKSTLFPKVFANKTELRQLFNAVNGTNYQETDEKILLLSEAFQKQNEQKYIHGCLECEVRMLNINYGHNKELMEKCKRLEEYSIFIAKIRKYAKDYPDRLDLAITKAIENCIAEDILKDFLIECESEVLEMVLYSFDKELYEEDLKQIAFEEGQKNGEKNKLIEQVRKKLARGDSIEKIADDLMENIATIQQIVASLE